MSASLPVAYAKATTVLAHAGQRITIRAGEPWVADDPLVEAYPDFFAAALPTARCTTDPSGLRALSGPETATAAPGETRNARRPRPSGGRK